MPYGKSLKLYIAIIQGAEAKSKRYSPVAALLPSGGRAVPHTFNRSCDINWIIEFDPT